MAFKYVHVFGEARLPGFARLYNLGHVPLDNEIVDKLVERYGAKPLTKPWSRVSDYDKYMYFQNWIRERFADWAPLAVEFHLWQDRSSE